MLFRVTSWRIKYKWQADNGQHGWGKLRRTIWNLFMSGAIKTRVVLGRLQKRQHRKLFGGSVNVTKTSKHDIFFLTLFKIHKNYHAITICHDKCCLATSAWKEVICANCVLLDIALYLLWKPYFLFVFKSRKVKKQLQPWPLTFVWAQLLFKIEKSLSVRASAWLTFT